MDKSQWQISDRFILSMFVVISIVLLTIIILPVPSGSHHSKETRVRLEERDLFEGLTNYMQHYGNFPTGSYSNIANILAGDNPKKIVFLYFRRTLEHPNEMVDPWNTPYKIDFSQQTNFVIRSAGKDKIFGDADDIVFNSVSNDFVRP